MRGVLFKDMLIRTRRSAVVLDLRDLGDVDLRGEALAAIASIAFREPVAVIDGNVIEMSMTHPVMLRQAVAQS